MHEDEHLSLDNQPNIMCGKTTYEFSSSPSPSDVFYIRTLKLSYLFLGKVAIS